MNNAPQSSVPIEGEGAVSARLGIASFILALISIVMMSLALLALFYVNSHPYSNMAVDTIGLIGLFSSPVFCLVGLGLSIAAVTRKNAKKTWSFIGLAFNLIALIVFVSFILLFVL